MRSLCSFVQFIILANEFIGLPLNKTPFYKNFCQSSEIIRK